MGGGGGESHDHSGRQSLSVMQGMLGDSQMPTEVQLVPLQDLAAFKLQVNPGPQSESTWQLLVYRVTHTLRISGVWAPHGAPSATSPAHT